MQLVPAKQLPLFQAPAPPRPVVVERVELGRVREVRVGVGPVAFEVLVALPGRADVLAARLGLRPIQVLGALGQLAVRGLAVRLKGYGASGVWARP